MHIGNRTNVLAIAAALAAAGMPGPRAEVIDRAVGFDRAPPRSVRRRKLMRRKYPVAIYGGNWKGQEYLSYREHDMFVRLTRLAGDEQADPETAMRLIRAARP